MKVRKTAASLLEYVEWTEQVAEAFTESRVDGDVYVSPWFRGMTSVKHKLVPGLYRSEEGRSKNSDDELRLEFKRRGLPLVAEKPPRDDWEWYSLMQHYGAPTRLLDWTDSALVALYFAICSSRLTPAATSALTPAVWALHPWKLNNKLDFYGPVTPGLSRKVENYLPPVYEGKSLPKYPIALDPTFIAQRMLVQHSHFTLHGDDVRGLDEMSHDLKLKDSLLRIVIETDSEGIRYMRQRLGLMGISETTTFPDLGGLARELSLEYEVYW